jgi:hypothetical protein
LYAAGRENGIGLFTPGDERLTLGADGRYHGRRHGAGLTAFRYERRFAIADHPSGARHLFPLGHADPGEGIRKPLEAVQSGLQAPQTVLQTTTGKRPRALDGVELGAPPGRLVQGFYRKTRTQTQVGHWPHYPSPHGESLGGSLG